MCHQIKHIIYQRYQKKLSLKKNLIQSYNITYIIQH